MTDTPTPQAMTQEQRAELVNQLRYDSDAIYSDIILDQLEADGLALIAAQAEIAQLKMANKSEGKVIVDMAGAMGEMTPEFLAAMVPIFTNPMILTLEAEIARLTAALATARGDGMREALAIARNFEDVLTNNFSHKPAYVVDEVCIEIEAAIAKGATT